VSVVLTETYVVKTDMQAEFTRQLDQFLKFKTEHPQLFAGLRSWKLYKQEIGQQAGAYIEMWEYESLAEMEQVNARIFGDKGMKAIQMAFNGLVEPATFCTSVWRPVA
jgi:hypothetical protein